jgi:hypothetical protein
MMGAAGQMTVDFARLLELLERLHERVIASSDELFFMSPTGRGNVQEIRFFLAL